jgi:hypothetical protein
LIAISIEKYATRPDVGKSSYEKGFVDVDMFYLMTSGGPPAYRTAAFFIE